MAETATLPKIITVLNSLDVSARWLYTILGYFLIPNSYTTNPMTTQELSEKACLSQRNIYRLMVLLKESGLIEVIKLEGKDKGKYQFYLKLAELSKVNSRDVYFVQGITTGHIKIGTSYNVVSRLANMQTNSSEELNLLGIIKKGGGSLEKELHQTFGDNRIHGEWFSPSPRLLSYIQDFT